MVYYTGNDQMMDYFVPDIVTSRLPRYLQTLNQMAKEGMHTVSSKKLADRLDSTAAQIRKDLSYFGWFGKQGTGYSIYYLIDQLQKILNLDRIWRVVIVGAGDLGRALVRYQGFAKQGIEIVMLYDHHPNVVGKRIGSLVVRHIDLMVSDIHEMEIKLAILTVPAEVAQSTADELVKAGIKAILNYAPVTLQLPEDIHVQHIDPVLQLQKMMYYLGDG
jgi:redox-sensing transcriptional repressor